MELQKIQRFYKLQSAIYDFTRPLILPGRKKAMAAMNVSQGNLVYDFACGTGLNIPHLIKKKITLSCVDYSADMLKRAQKKFPQISYPQITFTRADITKVRFGQKADKIICAYALSIIDNWPEALASMILALKKNGDVVILDFGKMKGILKIFYPVLRRWLSFFGVNPEIDPLPELIKNFKSVREIELLSGYARVIVARGKY
jgi:ubiquinone/menaquinone biosynthesis C-methylase UbiE